MEHRIRWENKNFDDMGTLNELQQLLYWGNLVIDSHSIQEEKSVVLAEGASRGCGGIGHLA